MRWRKLGLVYAPAGDQWWAKSHAMCPTPLQISPEIIRVFITCLDQNGIGRPGYVDVDAENPSKVLAVGQNPIFDIGKPGTFDDNGALVTSVLRLPDGTLFFYYVGFELCVKVRYRLFTGVAISTDLGVTAARYSDTPILDRNSDELYFRGGPCALWQNDRVRLWYVAGSEWIDIGGKPMPVYDLRYVESKDGLCFPNKASVLMNVTDPDEHGFGRPWVVRRGPDDFQLFYSIRRRSLAAYRLGYAESTDGLNWKRRDHLLNLDVSSDGFDNQAIMYSVIFSVRDKTYCFYNGNNFGEQGFGLAQLVEA